MKKIFLLLPMFFALACSNPSSPVEVQSVSPVLLSTPAERDSIIEKYLYQGAEKHRLYSQDYQRAIDKGIAIDSTIAYLWQQKAMPFFKQGKYEIGMAFVDKAVKYNPDEWQEYRAFIKCIFAKTYRAAIIDFEDCKAKRGNSYVMDHSYNFYIAISHLQLNQFEQAEKTMDAEIDDQVAKKGEKWVHHLDWFYQGVIKMEMDKKDEAIQAFDKALAGYPRFADAQFYKALILSDLDQLEAAKTLFDEAVKNGTDGYTINEDNVAYERYPYQVRWQNMQ